MKVFSKLTNIELTNSYSRDGVELFKSMTSQAKPFVFINDEPFWFSDQDYTDNLDLPFDVCFFEANSKPLFKIEAPNGTKIIMYGVLISDTDCFIIGTIGGHPKPEVFHARYREVHKHRNMYSSLFQSAISGIRKILEKLNSYDLLEGVQHHKRKMNGNGVSRRIGDVVYLLPKKGRNPSDKTSIPESVRHINFSHRFLRRGHWRVVGEKTIGKNRHGQRTELGRTWVKSSEIGEGILKEKLRVFK